jgi:hypothetical protein
MFALWADFNGGALVGIWFWVCVAAMVIVPSVAHYWYQVRKAELDTSLKQEMVARGYSAEDILAVINEDAKSLSASGVRAKMVPSKLPAESAQV